MYKIGDKFWWIPGYSGNHLIAIQVTITEIDDYFYKKDPNSYIFYWIDEPSGHSLDSDELFKTKEEAEKELLIRYHSELQNDEPRDVNIEATLKDYREAAAKFIISTHSEEIDLEKFLSNYPEKTEWFNVKKIIPS